MASKKPYVDPSTLKLLREKANKSPCTYRISGIAFDKKGDILGHATNNHATWNVLGKCEGGRPGTGIHVERKLIARYGELISTILICRIGHGGDILPIRPCVTCQKVANKYGIKIISVKPE